MRLDKISQCEANIRAGLSYHDIEVGRLLIAGEDRCFFRPGSNFHPGIERAVDDGRFEPWNHCIKDHGESAFCGWRETVARCSMQIIWHAIHDDSVECDFDYWNPDHGLLLAMLHFGELLHNKLRHSKTDPFKIAKMLRKRGFDV